jgi:hypothetical protein
VSNKYRFCIDKNMAVRATYPYYAYILVNPRSWNMDVIGRHFHTAADCNAWLREQATFLGIDFSTVQIHSKLSQ